MTNNTLAFIALCNEYCSAIESCRQTEPQDLTSAMLSLLPRIYITARDLQADGAIDEGYIDSALEEDTYDQVRRNLEFIFGENDTYLETFEHDMKYSDTPIAVSISENLADLFQVFYNFLETVRDAPDDLVESAIAAIKDDFTYTWSQTLCNVIRPLNALYYDSLQ